MLRGFASVFSRGFDDPHGTIGGIVFSLTIQCLVAGCTALGALMQRVYLTSRELAEGESIEERLMEQSESIPILLPLVLAHLRRST